MMPILMILVSVVTVLAASGVSAIGSEGKDSPTQRLGVYLHNDSTVFLQRFHFPAKTRLDSISLTVTGKTTGHVGEVIILGHEGGTMVPSINSQVLASYQLTKDSIGIQQITVKTDYAHVGGQLFIGVLDLKGDVRLLTDRSIRDTLCWDYGLPWNDQLRTTSHSYHVLPHAFKVVCHTSFNPVSRGRFQPDSLMDQLESDSFPESRSNIVICDLDNDGSVDILSRGVVQFKTGVAWTALAISSTPGYHAACNLIGDDQIEIVTVERGITGETIKVQQLRRTDNGSVATVKLKQLLSYSVDHIVKPKAHFIADLNKDHRQDVIFIGDRIHVIWGGDAARSGFTDNLPDGISDVSSVVALPSMSGRASAIVRTSHGDLHEILYQDGHWRSISIGTIEAVETPDASLDIALVDGRTVVIAPRWLPSKVLMEREEMKGGSSLLANATGNLGTSIGAIVVSDPVVFNEHTTAIAYADLDADGVDEVVVSTGGECHFLRVYSKESGVYRDITMDIGLFGIDNVDDFVLCDVNGDFIPDLCVARRGRFELYYNWTKQYGRRVNVEAHWIGGLPNTQVSIHQSQNVVTTFARSAHGAGMQQPHDLSVVLNGRYESDSVVIVWPDGARETFQLQADMNYQRGEGQFRSSGSNQSSLLGSNLRSATLEVSEPSDNLVVSVVNLDGKTIASTAPLTVQQGPIQLSDVLPLAHSLAAGVYVVVVHREGTIIQQQRFVHIP